MIPWASATIRGQTWESVGRTPSVGKADARATPIICRCDLDRKKVLACFEAWDGDLEQKKR
jgi:hypothetical protein